MNSGNDPTASDRRIAVSASINRVALIGQMAVDIFR